MRPVHLLSFPPPAVYFCLLAALVTSMYVHDVHAQQASPMAGHDMADMQAVPPPEQLPVPVRMTGIGNSHITIKATPEAQAWFDQGLSLQHDFWDYEAAKAFEQAIRVDPKCAMCWWGLALAEGARGKDAKVYARRALEEAVKLKDDASESDRLYIEAAKAGEEEGDSSNRSAQVPLYRKLVS